MVYESLFIPKMEFQSFLSKIDYFSKFSRECDLSMLFKGNSGETSKGLLKGGGIKNFSIKMVLWKLFFRFFMRLKFWVNLQRYFIFHLKKTKMRSKIGEGVTRKFGMFSTYGCISKVILYWKPKEIPKKLEFWKILNQMSFFNLISNRWEEVEGIKNIISFQCQDGPLKFFFQNFHFEKLAMMEVGRLKFWVSF